jgi:hypothetical protein
MSELPRGTRAIMSQLSKCPGIVLLFLFARWPVALGTLIPGFLSPYSQNGVDPFLRQLLEPLTASGQ